MPDAYDQEAAVRVRDRRIAAAARRADRMMIAGRKLIAERDRLREANAELLAALKSAVVIAEEARKEWDAAPSAMRAGKLLIALGGSCRGYRADIDAIHNVIAKVESAS